jgi:quinol monooxygenase YgiN
MSNKGPTIVNVIRLTVKPEHRRELCQTISSLVLPVRNDAGCLDYHFYEDVSEEDLFVVVGEWESADAWNRHVNSDNFAILLGAVSLLCDRACVDFTLLSHLAGAEAVTRSRVGISDYAVPSGSQLTRSPPAVRNIFR